MGGNQQAVDRLDGPVAEAESATLAQPSQVPQGPSDSEILGTGGDEVIHVLLDMMYAKAPYTTIQRAMHIHPTVAEYLPTILSKLQPFA
jgi:hypothetical protein